MSLLQSIKPFSVPSPSSELPALQPLPFSSPAPILSAQTSCSSLCFYLTPSTALAPCLLPEPDLLSFSYTRNFFPVPVSPHWQCSRQCFLESLRAEEKVAICCPASQIHAVQKGCTEKLQSPSTTSRRFSPKLEPGTCFSREGSSHLKTNKQTNPKTTSL